LAVADLVFAYDAALDRPIPVPDAAPAAVRAILHTAPQEAFAAAVATARETRAAALVLFGSTLDPLRASPAQAAVVRRAIVELAADGCRTIWMVDEAAACTSIARALGEPAGLALVSPVSPLRLDIRGVAVEIACLPPDARGLPAGGRLPPSFASEHASLLPPQHRIVIGWDDSWGGTPSAHALPAPLPAGGALAVTTSFVWGSRRPQPVPPGVHQLPALQARGAREAAAGSCGLLTLTGLAATGNAVGIPTGTGPLPRGDLLGGWREVATHRVAWRGLSITSLAGGDEELAAAVQTALDALVVDPRGPLQVVRVNVDCGASVSRRVRVAELVAETNARLRPPADATAQRLWCHDLGPDPLEPMTVLARGAAAHGAGSESLANSLGAFATALGSIVTVREAADHSTDHREAGWLALELMGST
jgi:hypothetical protein